MATQKDLLRTAILTGAVQATRVKANDFIDVSVAGDNYSSGEQTFISPVDGYFSIAVSDAEGSNRQYMGVKVHADGVEQSATVNDSGLSYACHVPVKKGSSVKIASRGSSKVWWAHFIKVIGGGHKRYLPTLSCNRFGGALWLRLKTTSETLQKQEACLPLRREGGFLTRLLSTRVMECGGTKPLPQLASSSSRLSTLASVSGISKTKVHTSILVGRLSASTQGRATCPVTRAMQSRTTLGAQADKPRMQVPLRSTSFLLSVASNNARMEVAA